MRPPDAVLLFALRLLAWLVPCFAAWYWLAPWLDRPAVWLARAALDLYRETLVQAVELDGSLVTFVTGFEVLAASGERGVLLAQVNPLVSTYGAALFAALLLASRGGWRRLLVGLAILVPFQAWSIAFDFLAQLVRAGPEAMAPANLFGWRAEAVALGYQLGSLIFPAVAPVVTWAALRRPFIAELVGARSP